MDDGDVHAITAETKGHARSRTASPQGAKAMTGVTPQQSGKAAIFSPG